MTAAPAVSPLGQRLADRTAPLAPEDGAHGWAHLVLCEGMMRGLQRVADIYDPPDPIPPGAPLLDPELCPDWALPWLAQLTGARIPDGTSPEDARTVISSVSGWKRGTPDALRAAAGLALTGTKTVYFRERDAGDAYRLEVVTLTSETPDPAQVQALLLSQKPGGIVLGYRTTDAWDYEQMTTEGGTYLVVKGRYYTYADLREHRSH